MKNIDWSSLTFDYVKTDYNVRCHYKNGQWGDMEVSSDEYIPIHMAAGCLHYGQEAFEGLKAFRGKDGKVRLFRWEENWIRMNNSARTIVMAEIPKELFFKEIETAIKLNADYIPPYGTDGAIYARPLLIGSGATVAVRPTNEFMFVTFVSPTGSYFKQGFIPTDMQLVLDCDRAAPLGTGHVKVGGNYAAAFRASERAHAEGFSASIFADSKSKQYIDEAGAANFFGIKDGKYITPDSGSILPSVTNKSLIAIAEDLGLKIERRHIKIDELSSFEEAGACGTAAGISPIRMIQNRETGEKYVISKDGKPGPICTKMREILTGIQYGELEDKHGWCTIINC